MENQTIDSNTKGLKWGVIVNPNAGSKKCSRDWNKIKNLLDASGLQYEAHFTQSAGHAIELAQMLCDKGFRNFIAVGGDGTMNEIVNGLLEFPGFKKEDFKIGMIPVGTGNDWCRMYQIPFIYEGAIEVIKEGYTLFQDLGFISYYNHGKMQSRYFVNVAGLGFDGAVAIKTNKVKEKGKGSKLSYMFNIFSSLIQYKTNPAVVSIDGNKIEEELFSMNVGICKFNGGGMKQVPFAIPDDGILDVTVIRKIAKSTVVINVSKLYDGSFVKLPEVSVHKAKKVVVDSKVPVPVEIDGESLGFSPLEFSICPSAVQFIVSKRGYVR